MKTTERIIESKMRRCGSTAIFDMCVISMLLMSNNETFNNKSDEQKN